MLDRLSWFHNFRADVWLEMIEQLCTWSWEGNTEAVLVALEQPAYLAVINRENYRGMSTTTCFA